MASFANESTKKFNPGELIIHHITDSHQWHFATVGEAEVAIALPVIVYNSTHGLQVFSSSHLYAPHGHAAPAQHTDGEHAGDHHALGPEYNGYALDSHEKLVALDGTKFIDLSITKNVASMLLAVIVLAILLLNMGKFYATDARRAPKGIASLLEPIVLFIRDEVAIPSIGEKKYKRFMPYLLTVFFFIWFNNLFGLLPGGANVTGNIAITLTLALFTFVLTNVNGNKDYWMHIVWTPGVPWPLKTILPIMPIVEIIGLFTKPVSLTIRLFANITAGHIIILSLLSLIFIFESFAVGIVAAAFSGAMNMLEFLVAILQAYVFTLLTANYIGSAVAEHEHHHENDQAHSVAAAH